MAKLEKVAGAAAPAAPAGKSKAARAAAAAPSKADAKAGNLPGTTGRAAGTAKASGPGEGKTVAEAVDKPKRERIPADQRKTVIDPERAATYTVTKVGEGENARRVIDNADEVAVMLRDTPVEELPNIAVQHGFADDWNRWIDRGLNNGMLRMNLGNKIRGKLRHEAAKAEEAKSGTPAEKPAKGNKVTRGVKTNDEPAPAAKAQSSLRKATPAKAGAAATA